MMQLTKDALKVREDLLKTYQESPLVDVLADSVARYDHMQQVVAKEGNMIGLKPHPLLAQLRSIGQTITGAIKVLGPSKVAESHINKVVAMKKPKVETR